MLTFFSAIITGILIFVLGQILLKIFIEPVQDLMRCLGQIRYCMEYHANIFCNPGVAGQAKMDQATDELRLNASKLQEALYLVRFFSIWKIARLLPPKKNIEQVSSELIGLSNSVHSGTCGQNVNRRERILNLISVNDESRRH